MRRHAKALSAGSTQGSGTLRARIRRAFATRGASSEVKGTGAPSSPRARLAFATLCVSLIASAALLATPALAAEAPSFESVFSSGVTSGEATLNAHIVPGASTGTTYRFEYGPTENYGTSVPIPDGAAPLPTGTGDITSGSTLITNVHISQGAFLTGQPIVSPQLPANTVVTAVGPETIEISRASGSTQNIPLTSPVSAVTRAISGLTPGATYHYRVVATNSAAPGGVAGPDHAFHTFAAFSGPDTCPNAALRAESNIDPESDHPFSAELPDCRAFERIASPSNPEVYVPRRGRDSEEGQTTERPFRAGAAGAAVAYIADPPDPQEGGNGGTGKAAGNQYFATRSSTGWTATNITPAGSNISTRYEAFSNNLSLGILHPVLGPPLTPDGVECEESLYSRTTADGAYHALFTETQTPGFCGFEEEPIFSGASADDSHLLFETGAALTADAEEAEEEQHNLYESIAGHAHLVNVLPGPSPEPDPNATFGAPGESGGYKPNFTNVISADGTRIYWTDLNTEQIYLREDGSTTVPVSTGPATYWTASTDGRFAYYAEGEELWRFDAQTETRAAIAGPGAEVQGPVGSSDDGSYLYFAAKGVLASNDVDNGDGEEEAQAGEPNLYVFHAETTTFIATLAAEDNEVGGPTEGRKVGDWRASLGNRTASVTPDGRHLAFGSILPLTGYDNVGLCGEGGNIPGRCPEVFTYDAEAGRVSCASCQPSGAPPLEHLSDPRGNLRSLGSLLPVSSHPTYAPRLISADGSRVFFDTGQPLALGDTNGRQDVYEWEQAGKGSCKGGTEVNGGGCVFLLSGGKSGDESYFVDADEVGKNVFFTTRGQLLPSDRDDLTSLYDAREGGGFPAEAEPSICESGEACKGPGSTPPSTQTPGTSTFSGPGNQAPKKHKKKKHHKRRAGKKHKHAHKHHKRDANHQRRAGR